MKHKLKVYTLVNRTILGLFIYLLLLPIISPVMEKILPMLWRCAYLTYTGNPCPFCGLTRDFHSLMMFIFNLLNSVSIFVFVFVLIELVFRISLLITVKKFMPLLIKLDVLVHLIILPCFISIIINYF